MKPPLQPLQRLLWLLAPLLLATSLNAAEQPSSRTCRIVFLAAPDDAPESLHLFDGQKSQPVELPRLGLSPPYALPSGDIHIALLTDAIAPSQRGKPFPVPAGAPTAAIPAAATDLYLLLSHDPSNTVAPVKIQVIDANSASFKRGQMLWFNLTPNKVGGILGTQKVVFEPNSKKVIDPPAAVSGGYTVNLYHLPPGKDRGYPICESEWIYDSSARSVFFILMPENKRTPHIFGMFDSRTAETTP